MKNHEFYYNKGRKVKRRYCKWNKIFNRMIGGNIMGQLVSDRVCYKHGVIKPENKMIELHAFCDCARCNYRKAYINNGLSYSMIIS